jgi:hypothetical protein
MELHPESVKHVLAMFYDKNLQISDENGDILSREEVLQKMSQPLHKGDTDDDDSKTIKKYTIKEIKKIEKKHRITMPLLKQIVDYSSPNCCQGIRKSCGLFVPCGTHVKSGSFCKVCVKHEPRVDELSRRMHTVLGSFHKTEIGLATMYAKKKSNETQDKEKIKEHVLAVINNYENILGVGNNAAKESEKDAGTQYEIDEYHKTIDWDRVNLKARTKRKTKPEMKDIGVNTQTHDVYIMRTKENDANDSLSDVESEISEGTSIEDSHEIDSHSSL